MSTRLSGNKATGDSSGFSYRWSFLRVSWSPAELTKARKHLVERRRDTQYVRIKCRVVNRYGQTSVLFSLLDETLFYDHWVHTVHSILVLTGICFTFHDTYIGLQIHRSILVLDQQFLKKFSSCSFYMKSFQK